MRYRNRSSLSLLAALAAAVGVLGTTSISGAQLLAVRTDTSAIPAAPVRFRPHVFVGGSGGIGLANVSHPDLATPHLIGPAITLEGGYAPTPYYSVAFVLRHFEQQVTRASGTGRLGSASSWLHTLAECLACEPDHGGGEVVSTTFLLHSIGPRLDLTPFGVDGPFIGAAAGLGTVTLIETRLGIAGSAHAGVQTTVADGIVTLAAEGGLEGQRFSDASAMVGYGTVSARFGF